MPLMGREFCCEGIIRGPKRKLAIAQEFTVETD